MLRLKNINTYYGKVHALKNISIHLAQGEIVTLIGANGAGKTTILNTISGVTPSAGGEILFEKEPVQALSPDRIVRLGIARCPKDARFSNRCPLRITWTWGHTSGTGRERRKAGFGKTSRKYLHFFRDLRNAVNNLQAPCPEVNSRCWPSAGR